MTPPALRAGSKALILHARSADHALLHRLGTGALQGRVHSVFDRVVNIEHGAGVLASLAVRGLDDAPGSARLDVDSFTGTALVVGDPVRASAGRLCLGGAIEVSFERAVAWQCRLPVYAGAPGGLRRALRAARAGRSAWMTDPALAAPVADGDRTGDGGDRDGHIDGDRDGDLDGAMGRALARHAAALLDALAARRRDDAIAHATSLIGLGPGLTPSGDDFLVGLFVVFHLEGSPCQGWLDGGAGLLAAAAARTNAISQAALAEAAKGRVRQSIVDLLAALLDGSPEATGRALQRVLAIGASSGADIAAGLLAGLELNLRVGDGG